MSYGELFALSNFTFLTGASHASELVERAYELGHNALAIADKNSFAGIVRGHSAAKEKGLRYIVAVLLELEDGARLLAYPQDRAAYGRLCRLLTLGKRRAEKGGCILQLQDIIDWSAGSMLAVIEPDLAHPLYEKLAQSFPEDVFIGLLPFYDGEDAQRFALRAARAKALNLPLLALGNVIMHRASRLRLTDILSCIREKCSIEQLGWHAQPNAERRLKSEIEMRRLFQTYPEAMQNVAQVINRSNFSLDVLRYEYPDEITQGMAPDERLAKLTEAGLARRYPEGVPLKVQAMVAKELRLICELDYARYFLTVYDVVIFARSKNILCQGRGSAANSVVCYALGITEASPDVISMVFERFVSEVRDEPPDIDVDFEHERREEVIQHIFEKYGRHRAAICSTVSHFRSRRAIREVGKAMGLSEDAVAALSSQVWGISSRGLSNERASAAGLDLKDPRLRQTLELAREIIGFPRHLSQHVGGFVITKNRLDELCPIENAAMEDRTIIEWDKDDIDELGMLKIDVLALGMLSCLRKAFDLLRLWKGEDYSLSTLPKEDPQTYDMLCKADTIGVFQVESRAQMNFLPRMRPRCFYDLVIEVAIIRPGPIQGDMVHPYIRRRRGEEAVVYPSEDLEPVLGKTLGVPLFQEQAMQIASIASGFTPSESDALRRSLGTFRGPGSVESFRHRFIEGCLQRGYDEIFAQNVFRQLEGFSGYGFPESHAASFALLVYASSWIKCHHPEIFCCALLNAQPLGFYAPAQIIRDACTHGVCVLPVCAEHSYWDNVLEMTENGQLAIRLGFRQVKGIAQEDGLWLASARGNGYRSIEALWRRSGLSRRALMKLAGADAFAIYGLSRREALWQVQGLAGEKPLPLFTQQGEGLPENPVPLPPMAPAQEVYEDYVATRLTLRDHPLTLLQKKMPHFTAAAQLRSTADGQWLKVAGLVITRQRPGTSSGVIFLTLEDDHFVSNIVVWPKIFEQYRKEVMAGRLLLIHGRLQREGIVTHVIAQRIEDYSTLLDQLGEEAASAEIIDPLRDNVDATRSSPLSSADKKWHEPAAYRPTPEAITHELQKVAHQSRAAGAYHPRQQAKKLFPSRDFH